MYIRRYLLLLLVVRAENGGGWSVENVTPRQRRLLSATVARAFRWPSKLLAELRTDVYCTLSLILSNTPRYRKNTTAVFTEPVSLSVDEVTAGKDEQERSNSRAMYYTISGASAGRTCSRRIDATGEYGRTR